MKPPTPKSTQVDVLPPPISITEDEAAKILEELNLIEINPPDGKEGVAVPIDIKKQIRLGIFSENIGGVRLRGGTLLLSEQIAIRHLQRLDSIAAKMVNANDLKDMSYPIGFLHKQIASSASKSKIIVEYVPMEQNKPDGSDSWEPGSRVTPLPPPAKIA